MKLAFNFLKALQIDLKNSKWFLPLNEHRLVSIASAGVV